MVWHFVPAVICTLAILVLSLTGGQHLPKVGIDYADKIAHIIAYFVLVVSWLWAFAKKNVKKHIPFTTLLLLCASCSIYGLLMEVLQGTLTSSRQFEISDMVANTIGCLFGILLYKPIKKASVHV